MDFCSQRPKLRQFNRICYCQAYASINTISCIMILHSTWQHQCWIACFTYILSVIIPSLFLSWGLLGITSRWSMWTLTNIMIDLKTLISRVFCWSEILVVVSLLLNLILHWLLYVLSAEYITRHCINHCSIRSTNITCVIKAHGASPHFNKLIGQDARIEHCWEIYLEFTQNLI